MTRSAARTSARVSRGDVRCRCLANHVSLVFSVDTPEKCKEAPVVSDEAAAFDNFAIPEPISKKPAAPPVPVNDFPIYQDDEGGFKDDELPAPSPFFTPNESCSTQNFSLFLKPQSVSTPIQKAKPLSRVCLDDKTTPPVQDENVSPPPSEVQQTATPPDASPQEAPPHYTGYYNTLPNKLSTIMETSENTNSTGAHTKSSISSPDSENEALMKGKSMASSSVGASLIMSKSKTVIGDATRRDLTAIVETTCESSLAQFAIGEDSIKQPTVVTEAPRRDESTSQAVKEPSLAFQIFEDKTENIERPPVAVEKQNTLVINESSAQRDVSAAVAPPKDPSLAFQIFEDKTETIVHPAAAFPRQQNTLLFNESKIDKENRALTTTALESPTICEPELSTIGFPVFKDSPKTSARITSLASFKFDDTQPVATAIPAPRPLISFEAPKPMSKAGQSAVTSKRYSNNDLDLDFFGKTPEKEREAKGGAALFDQPRPESSLMKFESMDKNTTQSLLKMNVEDGKHISLLARAEAPLYCDDKEQSYALMPLPQIKQERSLHINDENFSFANPGAPLPSLGFKSPDAPPPPPRPIFIEDDQINTLKFNPMLANIQNSTFIAPPTLVEAPATTKSLIPMPRISPIEQLATKASKLSISLDENELFHLTEEQAPEKRFPTISEEVKSDPPHAAHSRVSESAATTNSAEDFGRSIYISRPPVVHSISEEHWDDTETCDADADHDDQYVHSVINLDETNAIIGCHLSAAEVNPFDQAFTARLLERIEFLEYIKKQQSCTMCKKIKPLRVGTHVTCANLEFEVVKAVGKGAFGTVYRWVVSSEKP